MNEHGGRLRSNESRCALPWQEFAIHQGGYMDYDAEYLLNWCHALQFTLVIVSLRAIDRSSGGDRGGKTT